MRLIFKRPFITKNKRARGCFYLKMAYRFGRMAEEHLRLNNGKVTNDYVYYLQK